MSTEHSLRLMTEGDLDLVLGWRNHLEIRRYMYTTQVIDRQSHCQWFARASTEESRHLLIYQRDGVALGFVNLGWKERIAHWGFYAAPDAPKGSGRALGHLALKHAFDDLALHKVCGEALEFNQPSIGFHERLGFTREGTLREQHFDGKHFHSIICFGLLCHEWQSSSREF